MSRSWILWTVLLLLGVLGLTAWGGYQYLDSASNAPQRTANTSAAPQTSPTSATSQTGSAAAPSVATSPAPAVTASPSSASTAPAPQQTADSGNSAPSSSLNPAPGPEAIVVSGAQTTPNVTVVITGDNNTSAQQRQRTAGNDARTEESRETVDHSPNPDPDATETDEEKNDSDDTENKDDDQSSAEENEPDGEMIISGRVLNTVTAEPVSGITLTTAPLTGGGRERRTQSDKEGRYTFNGLANGEYRVSVTDASGYAPTTITVRAGLKSADITIHPVASLTVRGAVTDTSGNPVSGVSIIPGGGEAVDTDPQGAYELKVLIPRGSSFSLTVTDPAFERFHVVLRHDVESSETTLEQAIQLTPRGGGAVTGLIIDDTGQPLPSASVRLQSRSIDSQYSATTNADGRYTVEGVMPATDYSLVATKHGTHKTKSVSDIIVDGATPAIVDITLASASTGRISGTMLDVLGNPVPEFSMLVNTSGSGRSVTVSSDANGYFEADNVVAGPINFMTRSTPMLQVGGLTLEPGGDIAVSLVLDWGEHTVSGVVVGEDQQTVANAWVSIRWERSQDGLRSSMVRSVRTDTAGEFSLSQLGPGDHKLTISADGYTPFTGNIVPETLYGPTQYVLKPRQ